MDVHSYHSNHSQKQNDEQIKSPGIGVATSESNNNMLLESEDDQLLISAQNSDSQYNPHGGS